MLIKQHTRAIRRCISLMQNPIGSTAVHPEVSISLSHQTSVARVKRNGEFWCNFSFCRRVRMIGHAVYTFDAVTWGLSRGDPCSLMAVSDTLVVDSYCSWNKNFQTFDHMYAHRKFQCMLLLTLSFVGKILSSYTGKRSVFFLRQVCICLMLRLIF